MEMKTRLPQHELGTLVVVEASEVKRQEPVAGDKGTSITVRNLFYNIPARRNFLKSNPVELRHIVEEFQRLALARPDITFRFIQGDDVVHDLAPGKLSQRIIALFGKQYQEQLAPCQEETERVKVTGFIGRPESAKKTRGEQFLFVNQRYIKSNYIQHAVMGAYEGLLQDNSYPFYVLFIEIDPKHIDVNVHPTKTEIKFDDERAVYAVVRSAVKQALGSHNLTPAIDFHADVNLVNKLGRAPTLTREQYYEEQFGSTLERSNLQRWEKLFEEELPASRLFGTDPTGKVTLRFESAMNQGAELPAEDEHGVFQLHQRYLVRAARKGLMLIDQQAAHERILFEKFLDQMKGNSGGSQQSLLPRQVTLSPADFALVMEMEQEIKSLGFRFDLFGKNTLQVSGIPAGMTGTEKDLLEGLIEQFKKNQAVLVTPVRENLAQALAKRVAVKAGQKLTREEIESLVGSLFACSNPGFSPEGNTTFFVLDTSKIESYFNRL